MAFMRGSKLSVVAQQPLARGSAPLHPEIVAEQSAAPAEATAQSPTWSVGPTDKPACTVTRVRTVALRVSPQEFAVIEANARDAGLSISSYLRKRAIGTAGPRSRRKPTIDAELMAYAVAQLNRVGSNLNQIARSLNLLFSMETEEVNAAAREVREAVRLICRSLGIQ